MMNSSIISSSGSFHFLMDSINLAPVPRLPCRRALEQVPGSSCSARRRPRTLQGRCARFRDCCALFAQRSCPRTRARSWAAPRGSGSPWWSLRADSAHCQGCHKHVLGLRGLGSLPLAPNKKLSSCTRNGDGGETRHVLYTLLHVYCLLALLTIFSS